METSITLAAWRDTLPGLRSSVGGLLWDDEHPKGRTAAETRP